MASLFGLGFLKGAAQTGLDRIEKRDEYEREVRKQELLTRLRMQTEKEVADYNDLLLSRRASDDFSGADEASGKFITRNNRGEQIGERDLTSNERQALADKRAANDLDRRVKEAQISNYETDNALSRERLGIERMNAETNRRNAETNARGLQGADSAGRNELGSFNVGSEIIRANDKVAQGLIQAGVPPEEVSRLAARAAANAKARKQGFNEAQQYFIEGARLLRGAATEMEDPKDPAKVRRGYSDDVGLESINKYRTARGLSEYGQ